MARQITNAHFASEPARTIYVVAPKDGIPVTITPTPGCYLNLDFDPTEADHSRRGSDLVSTFSDGNVVTFAGFFAVDNKSPPSFILPNGSHVTVADMFTGIDISPALGSPAIGQKGSGAGEYADDTGNLIDGVSRLGSLGTDSWGRDTEDVVYFTSKTLAANAPGIDTPSAFVPTISIRPLPPGEWSGISVFSGTSSGPGYSVSATGDAILFDEAYLNGGSMAGGTGTSLAAYLVYEIISNDGLTSVTIGGTTYAVAADGSVSGVVGYQFSADADGCGSVSKAFVMEGSTPGTYYLAIEYTLTHAHGHAFGVGNPQSEQLGDGGVSVGSANGASSETVSGTVDVQDDGPSLDMESGIVYSDDGSSYKIEGELIPRFGADGVYGASGNFLTVSHEVFFMDNDILVTKNISDTQTASFDSDGKATVHTALGVIEFVKSATGDISYVYRPNNASTTDCEKITFAIMDGDGDTSMHDTSITSRPSKTD